MALNKHTMKAGNAPHIKENEYVRQWTKAPTPTGTGQSHDAGTNTKAAR